MIILSILFAATAAAPKAPAPPSAARAVATAKATVRILVPQSVNADGWTQAASGSKKEVMMRDSTGQWIKLRLIENE